MPSVVFEMGSLFLLVSVVSSSLASPGNSSDSPVSVFHLTVGAPGLQTQTASTGVCGSEDPGSLHLCRHAVPSELLPDHFLLLGPTF